MNLLNEYSIVLLQFKATEQGWTLRCQKSTGTTLGLQVCLFTICTLDKSEVKYFINGMFRSILNHPVVSAAWTFAYP